MTWEDILKQENFDLIRPNYLVELLEKYGKEDVIDVLETMLKNNEQSLKEQNKAFEEFFKSKALKDRTIGNNNYNTYKESMEALQMLIDKEDLDISKLRYGDDLEYIDAKEEFLGIYGNRAGGSVESMLITTLKQVIRELKKKGE
jgi:aspartyl/asparaginyl-tRNA synthetase